MEAEMIEAKVLMHAERMQLEVEAAKAKTDVRICTCYSIASGHVMNPRDSA